MAAKFPPAASANGSFTLYLKLCVTKRQIESHNAMESKAVCCGVVMALTTGTKPLITLFLLNTRPQKKKKPERSRPLLTTMVSGSHL
jgi:hypothetical protein